MIKINGIEVVGDYFAYDGCHKIYILEDEKDRLEAKVHYMIVLIKNIKKVYSSSCELRFIDNWKLTKVYAKQGEFAEFEIGKEGE